MLQFTHVCFLPRVQSPHCPGPCNCFLTLHHWNPPGLLHWPKHEGSWVWGLVWFSTHSFSDNNTDGEVTPPLVFSVLSPAGSVARHIGLVCASCCANGGQFFWHSPYSCRVLLPHVKRSRQTQACGLRWINPLGSEFVLSQNTDVHLGYTIGWAFVADFWFPSPVHWHWEVTGTSLAQNCLNSLLQQNHGTEQLLRVWSCISVGKLETPAIDFLFGAFICLVLLHTSENRGHKEYPSSYICVW